MHPTDSPFPPELLQKLAPQVGYPSLGPDAQLVQLPSGALHIEVTPPASKPSGARADTLLFLHGAGGSGRHWQPLIEDAHPHAKHRVVVVDLEGHGLSPFSPLPDGESYGAVRMAQLVKEVVDWLEADKVVLVAHSLGAYIATLYAARHPDKVSKMFLVNPVMASTANNSDPAQTTALVNALLTSGTSFLPRALEQTNALAPQAAIQPTGKRPRQTQRWLARALITAGYKATSPLTLALYAVSAWGPVPHYAALGLKSGKVLVMVVEGVEDGMVGPAMKADLRAGFDGAHFVTVPGSGHFAPLEDVEAVSELFDAFVL